MRASVVSVEGKKLREISLPASFEAEVDSGLIRRAVLSMRSMAVQPKGIYPLAGRENTARYIGRRSLPASERGINVGRARLPRLNNRRGRISGRVASVPRAVGGPVAHPPKVEAKRFERINRKERKAALDSAVAATAKSGLVGARHVLPKEVSLPVVVEDSFEGIKKTKGLKLALKAMGLLDDVENAKAKARRRAGRGKMRGRKKRQKKSILIVTGKSADVFKAARNLPGVDVCAARNLNAELLAPGCVPGRLVLWSEAAIAELGKRGEAGERAVGKSRPGAEGKKRVKGHGS